MQFCRLQARPQLDNLAQRTRHHRHLGRFGSVCAGKDHPEGDLHPGAVPPQVYEAWGFAGKSQRGLGMSALFVGQSGTGKTMAAEVLAQQFQLDLHRIDLSSAVSKYSANMWMGVLTSPQRFRMRNTPIAIMTIPARPFSRRFTAALIQPLMRSAMRA